MMVIEEAAQVRRLRGDWLRAEKAILAKHRAQFVAHAGAGGTVLVEKPMESRADAVGTSGVGPFGLDHDRGEHDFKRVNPRGGVFQGLYLVVVHALVLLRLRKPNPPADSVKTKAEKEAA